MPRRPAAGPQSVVAALAESYDLRRQAVRAAVIGGPEQAQSFLDRAIDVEEGLSLAALYAYFDGQGWPELAECRDLDDLIAAHRVRQARDLARLLRPTRNA